MRRLPLALLTLLVGITLDARPAGAQTDTAEAEILATNEASVVAWNRGDLAGHVAMYADSAAFMTGRGPIYGRQTTADALERSFFRDGRPLQQLRFENVTVQMLGDAHAMVVGRFVLSGGGMDERSGWYTTVWERRPEGWRIIHDHSS